MSDRLDTPAGRAVIEAAGVWLTDYVEGIDRGEWHDPRNDGSTFIEAAAAVRVPCETCGGDGAAGTHPHAIEVGDPCADCEGEGTVSALRVLLDEEGA